MGETGAVPEGAWGLLSQSLVQGGVFAAASVLIFVLLFLGWRWIGQPAFDRAVEASRNNAAAAAANQAAAESNRAAAAGFGASIAACQSLAETLEALVGKLINHRS